MEESKNSSEGAPNNNFESRSNCSSANYLYPPGCPPPQKRQPPQLKWILASSENGNGSNVGNNGNGFSQQMMSSGAQSGEEILGGLNGGNPGGAYSGGSSSKSYSTPQIKNHTATLYNKKLYVFGGYDGKKNHSNLRIFDTETSQWVKTKRPSGNPPTGRNGHTATLVDHKLYIIGGWLGQGPLAADDMHILDLENNKWVDFQSKGIPPGPCNMHTADCYNNKIYVFRGGDGKDYLNDLHELDTQALQWTRPKADGVYPPPRANHSSSLIKQNLYIFGGWDGSKRLNDLYMLDLDLMFIIIFIVQGDSPAPRAGMSLCNVNNKLFLFGGSGPHAYCFNDLFIFDPDACRWSQCDNFSNPECQPKARAGHSKTIVDSRLFIIGGSYGQDYLKDVYILDTDPCPQFQYQASGRSRLLQSIRDYTNREEFSDITFIVEGKKFYAHKLILSLLSERFKAMFSNGMIESKQRQINIDNISYPVFSSIMHYLYTGDFHFGADLEGQEHSLEYLFEFLRVADEYILEDVKMCCEKYLIDSLTVDNFASIVEQAELYNAERLKEYCHWFYRRNASFISGAQSDMTSLTPSIPSLGVINIVPKDDDQDYMDDDGGARDEEYNNHENDE